jgi:nucleotide-binding universal stress UspA family protein
MVRTLGRVAREEADVTSEGDTRRSVVVGVDGSDGSVAALRWAARYSADTGAPVRAVLVWHYPTTASAPPPGRLPEQVETGVENEERDNLRKAVAKAGPDAPGAHIDPETHYGHPAEVLIELSGEASLLVVGRHGHGGFFGRHLGSVSLHCVNAAQCPVVVVHSGQG